MLKSHPIKIFNPRKASTSELSSLNEFENSIRAEQWPDDPPIDLGEDIRNLQYMPPYMDVRLWLAWSDDQIIGRARLLITKGDDNQHLAVFHIAVLSEMRRQGIARRLLPFIAEAARKENRRLLIAYTDSAVPSGEVCVRRLGARMGQASHTNQLTLADLNRNLIQHWQEQAPTREFNLGVWEGPYPKDELKTVVAMRDVMNTEPRDNLEMEDRHWTVEQLTQWDASLVERKVVHWTIYARHAATGEIASYTEVFWNPSQPHVLGQGDTGVFPKYRNRGLGRWLKAAMLEKVLCDRPEVRYIRTGNADSNAPMLKINYELGFKPYKSWASWQVDLDKVFEYLEVT